MKKALKIILITFIAILVLLIISPFIFKDRIETLVRTKVNEQVAATVDWDRFSLTFFRGFPELSAGLHEVSVVGKAGFEGDTLAALDLFELRLRPFSVLKKQLVVSSIVIDKPLLNAIVLEDGSANWDIAISADTLVKEEEAAEGGSMDVSLVLDRFAILDGRIYYVDLSSGTGLSAEDFSLELKGDVSLEQTDISMDAGIGSLTAYAGGINYLDRGVFKLHLIAGADLVNGVYELKNNLISLNGLALGAEGKVRMLEEGAMDVDLSYFTKETTFKTLLSLVPGVFLKDFDALETGGKLALKGSVKGLMKDSILPDVGLELAVSDAWFSYPDLPEDVRDIQLSLLVNYHGREPDLTVVNLERFHFSLADNPFDLSLRACHPFSDLRVSGGAEGRIDFEKLSAAIPMEDTELAGLLKVDLAWDTRMSAIEAERFEEMDLQGQLVLEAATLSMEDLPVPVNLDRLQLTFTPRLVELGKSDIRLGRSDLHLQGSMSNFLPYVFNGETIKGELSLSSKLLDLNEIMPKAESTEESVAAVDSLVPPTSDTLAVPSSMKIPENIAFTLGLDLDQVLFNEMDITNLKGKLILKDGTARLTGLRMHVIDGVITCNGLIDTRQLFTSADLKLSLKSMNIPAAYETFLPIEKLLPLARSCDGKASINMQVSTMLDESFTPLYESLNASGRLRTADLSVKQSQGLDQLASTLKNDKLKSLKAKDMLLSFKVRNGRISVEPFDLKFSDSQIGISGSHGIDLSMDYDLDLQIARSDLGPAAGELFGSISSIAGQAGLEIGQVEELNMKAHLGGTFNKPVLRPDFASAGTGSVAQQVKEEVKQLVEQKVREEVDAKKEEYLAEAQAEADRLMEEARKQGDRLVAEARVQGERLKKEAGSNPLKQLAAKAAADELEKQAREQKSKILAETQKQADSILQKARDAEF